MSARRIVHLFTRRPEPWRSRSSPDAAPRLGRLITAGLVTLRPSRVPAQFFCDAWASVPEGNAGDGTEHQRMKRAMREWMKSCGASDAREEARGYGGRFDAYSESAGWIVEVGNTRIDKLLDAICDEDAPRFTLLPYQRLIGSTGEPRGLIAVDFVWGPEATARLISEFDDEAVEARREQDRRDRDRRARMIADAQARKAARLT